MTDKKYKLLVTALLAICLSSGYAQNATSASGGDVSGSGGSAAISLGQASYTTNIGTSGSVSQGIQQPYEIFVLTGIVEATGIDLKFNAYPNPATDFIILKLENYDNPNLSFQFYDINGKVIYNKKLIGLETIISMKNHAPSTYFLKVTDNNKEVKSFKIIKK
jgi:hypothetical protein